MKENRILLGACLFALTFSFCTSALASEVIGLLQPRDWGGSGARVQYYDPGRIEKASDLSNVPFATTETSYYQEGPGAGSQIDAWARSSYKQLSAYIYAEGYDYVWQTGGFYRDQIYFATYNNAPAELRMAVNVNATGSTYDGVESASAMLSLGWAMYYGTGIADYYLMSNQFPIATNSLDTWYSLEDERITLSSADGDYLIASGSYVPYSLAVWGTVLNGEVDWANTIDFVEFTVFQNGVQLSPDQYTIVEGVQAVPIPPSVLLVGTGLLGLMGYRRFWKNT